MTATELTFARTFSFKKNKHNITGTMQPYCVGMYIAIQDTKVNQLIQLNIPHKEVKNWLNSLTKKFTKEGYTNKKTEGSYVNYLKVDEIETYILPELIKKKK